MADLLGPAGTWLADTLANTLTALKDVAATIEKPKARADQTPDSYGAGDRTLFDPVAATLAHLQFGGGSEQVEAKKLTGRQAVTVTINRPVQPMSIGYRLTITSGVLAGRHLYIESIAPVPGFPSELTLACNMTGAAGGS